MPTTEELRVLLRTVSDTSGAAKTQTALKGVQAESAKTGQSLQALARSGAAGMAALGVGAVSAQQAFQMSVGFMRDSIDTLREHQRISRAVAAGYGEMAGEWTKFATALSQTTGNTSDAILQAALKSRTLTQNY